MAPLNFGQALEALKQGKCVSRVEWADNGLYLWLARGSYPVSIGTTGRVRHVASFSIDLFDKGEANSGIVLPSLNMTIPFGPTIPGWQLLPSDVLAEDWFIAEPRKAENQKVTKEEELP